MPSVFNHLIHPLTYTADNGETRYLSSEECSRVKNYVLAAMVLAVSESLFSSRSLKSSVIIIIVTASVVFYVATAILKMLGRGESAPSKRSADPAIPDLSRPRPEREKSTQAARKLQDEQYDALLAEARKRPARSAAVESRSRQPAPQPVGRRDVPLPQQKPPSPPSPEFKMPEIFSRVSTAIFGEEDFSKKPSWVEDPLYQKGPISLHRAYFASLWKKMYEGGFDVVTHEMEFSDNDEKLRKGEYQVAAGAPWASFAEHARKKLIEEWNKKSDFRKALSPYVPFV